ncbi:holin, partial [Acinetobacter baumannii]
MSDTQSAVGVTAAKISQKVTANTGGGSFFGFLAKIDVISWGGLVIAALVLAVQLYFVW